MFGPELVMLGPDEQFTQLSLSGGKPKKQNVIKSLCLLLGPDFCTDIITVETADHARLSLQLSYNWHFDIKNKEDKTEAAKIFSVPDFVGDACKAIASRIRGAVAQVQFDDFHKVWLIICTSVDLNRHRYYHWNSFIGQTHKIIILFINITHIKIVLAIEKIFINIAQIKINVYDWQFEYSPPETKWHRI